MKQKTNENACSVTVCMSCGASVVN